MFLQPPQQPIVRVVPQGQRAVTASVVPRQTHQKGTVYDPTAGANSQPPKREGDGRSRALVELTPSPRGSFLMRGHLRRRVSVRQQ
jgi:hypothetical protein